jgi:enterochelin esterase-like enzyme
MKSLFLLCGWAVYAAAQAPVADGLAKAALEKGEAWASREGDFLFAIVSAKEPRIVVDEGAPQKMSREGDKWVYRAKLRTGTIHRFHYLIDGAAFGGKNDVPAYSAMHYEAAGVPQGKLTEKMAHKSKIYDGMESDYWVYTPAQYKPGTPAAVMVWQDGQGLVDRNGASRLQNVIDHLIHAGKMPVSIHVFVAPGKMGERAMRSVLYDTVTDRYGRFLRDEILDEVSKRWTLRTDGYSRAIAGNSSGGICAFNVAWFMPREFSRVLSRIGSFTSIQWKPGELDGGNVYPNKIRKEPKRNIRVWLQDGSEDLENAHGSWPLQNIQMANSLKMREYDFHLSWSHGTHNAGHGNAESAEALTWLWRGYDAAKNEDPFEMDAAEKTKPYFRVKALNRE